MRSRHISRQSKKFATRRRTQVVMYSIGWVILAGLMVWGTSALSSWKVLQLNAVQVSGIDENVIPHIRDTVMKALSGNYMGMYSRANAFLYPRTQIKIAIQDQYQEIRDIKIDRADRHTVRVSIEEKDPAALICPTLPDFNGSDITLDDPGSCYFADSTGLMFKKAPTFSGNIFNKYYIPDLEVYVNGASSTPLVGRYATSTEEFSLVQDFYNAVRNNKINTDAVLVKGSGEYELYIQNPDVASSTAVVYFNTLSSTTLQLANFISFWNYTISEARTNKRNIQFDYIDVRYGSNIYHRLVE